MVKEHAQRGNPELKAEIGAVQSSVVGGVIGAVSKWVAHECNRVSDQELSPEAETLHAELVQDAKHREFAAWKKFDVFEQRNFRNVSKQIAQTRWISPGRWRIDRKATRPVRRRRVFRTQTFRKVLGTHRVA